MIFVSDHLKTEKMCNEAVEQYGGTLGYVPDCYKTDEMYERAVENGLCNLKFIPDWFVTQQQIKSWHDYDIIVMMIDFLSGTMVIKIGRPRKHNQKRVNAYCLAPIKMVGLVCS